MPHSQVTQHCFQLHTQCVENLTPKWKMTPADFGAPLLNTTTSNYLCCAIMPKASPRFLMLQLQVTFSKDSNFKNLVHRKSNQLNEQGQEFAESHQTLCYSDLRTGNEFIVACSFPFYSAWEKSLTSVTWNWVEILDVWPSKGIDSEQFQLRSKRYIGIAIK